MLNVSYYIISYLPKQDLCWLFAISFIMKCQKLTRNTLKFDSRVPTLYLTLMPDTRMTYTPV